MKPISLYLHSPFCTNKCGYCDFNSWGETARAPQEQWLTAIQKQIAFWAPKVRSGGYAVRTVFHGGGTPSLIALDLFEKLSQSLQAFDLSSCMEWTIEANPETLTQESLALYESLGVTRLSVGLQSFDDGDLQRLERRARKKDNLRALELIQKYWKGRWSGDLMFGLPGQTLEKWRTQLDTLLPFQPKHISCYQLTLTTARSKNWQQPGEDELLKQFEWTREYLKDKGLVRYEVSNFAVPGFECEHNLVYWRTGFFLGLGPGAAGVLPTDLLGGGHQKQPDRFEAWAQKAGDENFEKSILSPRSHDDAIKEKLMMSLRLAEGIKLSEFPKLQNVFERWQKHGWAQESQGHLALSESGLAILNTLLVEAFEHI